MPSSGCESVTVTLLPDVLALVHIPRSRLNSFSHQVVKQILTPAPSFLNITCNKIELSLFAHQSILAEFEPLARKDRQRLRRAANFRRSHARSRYSSLRATDPVEVSYDTWNVLQLDSHDDRLDKAGARVRELSAPLAEAGISILYQSSYTSDFIFVKSSRLTQVLARLAQAGFVGYSFDLSSRISPILSTTPCQDNDTPLFTFDDHSSSDPASRNPVHRSADPPTMELVLQRDEVPASLRVASPASETNTVTPTPPVSAFARRSSISPCAGDVQILEQDIICVGLSDACADTWASKIIKLVAYPELIAPASSSSKPLVHDPFDTMDATLSPLDESEMHAPFGISIPHPMPSAPLTPDPWSTSPSASDSSSLGTSPSSSEEDGYFSSASPYSPSGSTPSLLSCSRSYPELCDVSSTLPSKVHLRSRPRPRLPRLNTLTGSPAATPPPSSVVEDPREKAVPFFTFTRTAEGSSLTTGLGLIATLFPPSERHMVICSGELGMGEELDNDGWGQLQGGAPSPVSSTMRCLQIDLQRFGLDKHGLISRFSRVLDSNGINHMYSSTYKTANLLVDKADAVRAQALLRSC